MLFQVVPSVLLSMAALITTYMNESDWLLKNFHQSENGLKSSRVSRGNETNVKTQLFRREENKRLVSFCRGIFTLLTNLSVPRWNETNHNFIVISFIPS